MVVIRSCSATAAILTNSFLVLVMAYNHANAISKHFKGCEETLQQGKRLHNSRKL